MKIYKVKQHRNYDTKNRKQKSTPEPRPDGFDQTFSNKLLGVCVGGGGDGGLN